MSSHDQCPSTTGKDPHKAKPKHSARTPHELVGTTGRAYWRSAEDLADTSEFRDFLEREFPSGASELLTGSRRTFMKIMGASVALAGAATIPGCRRPEHTILPYSAKVPEETIPGKATYYATSMPLPGGGAEGLIVESHEGRPTKIEGNPLHPINRGKSSVWSQASVLNMYDPDRLTDPVHTEKSEDPLNWEYFTQWSRKHFAPFDSTRGEGIAVLTDKRTSPTLNAMKSRFLKRWPNAMWIAYDAVESDESLRGSAMAFGRPMRELHSLEKANVIVSLDRDFLDCESNSLPMSRGYAAGRRSESVNDSMNRLYVVESNFTLTGGKADHRFKLAPSLIPAFAVKLAAAVLALPGVKGTPALANAVRNMSAPATLDDATIKAIAEDLVGENLGKSVIMAGPTQPAAVHALVHALNEALGNIGQTVNYIPMGEDEAASSTQGIGDLTKAIDDGKIKTIVCLNANPVYNAPVELDFAAKFKKVPTRITLSLDWNETVEASTWRLNAAHYLESWGDTEAADGTIAPIQPLIAPLYLGKSDIEVLAIILAERVTDGYELVRTTWRERVKEGDFEKIWRRSLHDGVLAGSAAAFTAVTGAGDRVAVAIPAMTFSSGPSDSALDVVFTVGHVGDGRWANNTWLQELPHPVSKIVWDNVAYVSPATAKRLGIRQSKETDKKQGAVLTTLTIGGQSVDIAAWSLPGLPDNVVIVPLGYGRTICGRVGVNVGFNSYKVRNSTNRRFASGAKLARVTSGSDWYHISTTQTHGSMEGRAIVRETDLPRWKAFGFKTPEPRTDPYGNKVVLSPAEQLGELGHSPANKSIYVNPYNRSAGDPDPNNLDSKGKPPAYAVGPQWGMTIDLSTCTGCGVCTIACQSENNIPVVGKMEVSKYREMHWIRVDRYFTEVEQGKAGETADSMAFQPVACVHCENAPCEVVCPVNATVHGPEGLNYMTYNRCIGTRYCANNCPYKVRRFNFFDFGVAKFNGDYLGKELMPMGGPKNVNLIPPRLRDRLDEISKMGMNPDVTVRSRGVMEKCSYCVQRINEARIEVKLKNLPGIPDGMFQTACQQACPTDAIIFGDRLDTNEYTNADGTKRTGSRVRNAVESPRSYALLGFLNTRPRTSHLLGIRNPNPALVADTGHGRRDLWKHGFDDHGHHDEHHHHDHDHDHSHDGHDHGAGPSRRSYLKHGTRLSLNVLAGSGVLA